METAEVFEGRSSQVVRLPKKIHFNADAVVAQQVGEAVILVSKEHLWRTFIDGLEGFTSDIRAADG